jgi:hypothetical protein
MDPDYQYVARFKGVKGRYAVSKRGLYLEGQKILDRRQLKYGNHASSQGLFLDEMLRTFSANELVSLKPLKPSPTA